MPLTGMVSSSSRNSASPRLPDDRTTTGRAKASVSGSAPPSRSAQPDPAVAVGVQEPDGGRAPLRQVIDRPRSVSVADGDEFHRATAQLISREPFAAPQNVPTGRK